MLTHRATIEQTIACNRNQTKMGNLSRRISGDPKRCWLDKIGHLDGRRKSSGGWKSHREVPRQHLGWIPPTGWCVGRTMKSRVPQNTQPSDIAEHMHLSRVTLVRKRALPRRSKPVRALRRLAAELTGTMAFPGGLGGGPGPTCRRNQLSFYNRNRFTVHGLTIFIFHTIASQPVFLIKK